MVCWGCGREGAEWCVGGVVERGWSGVLGCGREGVEWCVGEW